MDHVERDALGVEEAQDFSLELDEDLVEILGGENAVDELDGALLADEPLLKFVLGLVLQRHSANAHNIDPAHSIHLTGALSADEEQSFALQISGSSAAIVDHTSLRLKQKRKRKPWNDRFTRLNR